MQSKLDQARRLCTALDLMLADDDTAHVGGPTLTDRTQVIVDRLAQLAEDPSVRKNLRATIGATLVRWQEQTSRRGERLTQIRDELSRLDQGRKRLAHLALSCRFDGSVPRLHATA